MKVKDLMTSKVVTVNPDTPISEVADILHKFHFTGVPVVDDNGVLLGVIMERDFITADSKIYLPTYIKMLKDIDVVNGDKRFMNEDANAIMKLKAKDVMNTYIVTVSEDATIEEAAELFATKRVNPIPVIDGSHHVVGVISRSDLIELFTHKTVKATREHQTRLVDRQVSTSYKDLRSRFTLVARTRVSIWWVIAFGLMVIGFVIGQAWLVNLG
ncbi:MAG TPA: CBS domain-containing protein [Patescibacteria group bacterium]|nr:CBS domain-containing protein [Patescibacteria group bacterium]